MGRGGGLLEKPHLPQAWVHSLGVTSAPKPPHPGPTALLGSKISATSGSEAQERTIPVSVFPFTQNSTSFHHTRSSFPQKGERSLRQVRPAASLGPEVRHCPRVRDTRGCGVATAAPRDAPRRQSLGEFPADPSTHGAVDAARKSTARANAGREPPSSRRLQVPAAGKERSSFRRTEVRRTRPSHQGRAPQIPPMTTYQR